MNIHGKKVILRAIEETDLPLLHQWANDPEIWKMLGGWHFPSSFEYQKKWFAALGTDQLNQRFAVEAPGVGLIGTTNLVDVDWKNNNAFHGVMLGAKDIRGKGYGIDTIMSVMRFAFEELHLERLDTTIIEYNTISLNIYTNKCGWKHEGTRRNWYFRNNRYWDRLEMGITRADYFALVEESNYWADDQG
ncbi:GNAT family N-acetyltransferase [Hymenobacter glacieicola]|uniref:N-acetyltransferase n=1 Tax=Hymenobacter glacieicola TaxID=1562124 RepID=A0ABQ1X097_9BACT|nr:GNAT family protein [Hymenobacter glacieicola]GGG53486.1 N-acetyltransferase [Hymenobacter glacieicola]